MNIFILGLINGFIIGCLIVILVAIRYYNRYFKKILNSVINPLSAQVTELKNNIKKLYFAIDKCKYKNECPIT